MLWLVVIHMAGADTVSASPSQDAQAWNLPHGILAPTAPYPARNIDIQSRRAPAFELPLGDQGDDLSPAQLKESEGLFGPNPLGPPNPRERFNFAPQLPGYPGPPPPFQRAPKEQSYELPGVVGGVLDGSPAFRQEMERLSRLAEPQPNRPMIRPGGQDYPVGNQQGPPMNPWYGLPVPTSNAMGPVAMGPYFQRRPKPSYFTSTASSVPLAPLRDIEHSTRLFDSWLDQQVRGRGPRRPRPELGPLAPPSMPRGNHGGNQGKMFAPRYSRDRHALVSREKVYVSQGTRPTYATRGLLPDLTETTPRPPPPLLDDEGGLDEPAAALEEDAGLEERPGSENVSLFSRERKQLSALRQQASNTENVLLL